MWLAVQYHVPIVAYGEHRGPVPHGIPLARTLDDVKRFVARHVGREEASQ
jgi:hypothetical protein